MMFIAGLFLSMGVALAQTQVNGTVTSADDGEPVIGASVLVEGTKTGTVTDINGNFSISVPAGKKLVISYLGMQTQTVSAKPGMRIELAADSQTLEDLVVVGYGTGRKVGTVIGSVSTVGSDKLKNAPLPPCSTHCKARWQVCPSCPPAVWQVITQPQSPFMV